MFPTCASVYYKYSNVLASPFHTFPTLPGTAWGASPPSPRPGSPPTRTSSSRCGKCGQNVAASRQSANHISEECDLKRQACHLVDGWMKVWTCQLSYKYSQLKKVESGVSWLY